MKELNIKNIADVSGGGYWPVVVGTVAAYAALVDYGIDFGRGFGSGLYDALNAV